MLQMLQSTIGRKQIVGLAGLGLALFVLVHMAGNLLLFKSAQSYNEYGHALISNPLIGVAQAGLVALFLSHVILALLQQVANWRARPQRYAVAAAGEKKTTLVQKTLWAQGVILLVFLIFHLVTFKWGAHYSVSYGGPEIRDLFRLVVEKFKDPFYVAFYVFCLGLLFGHLNHGVQSAIRTLGFNHPRYDAGVRALGGLYAVIVSVGFIAQPLYIFFLYEGAL